MRYMSQSLTNDLPDKFGSSDEDDDDEEVVGWMGEGGEFEARTHDNDEGDEDDEDVRGFGRRGLFHDRWEGDFHDDDDEFGFRGLGAGLMTEEHDINVKARMLSKAYFARVPTMTTIMRRDQS